MRRRFLHARPLRIASKASCPCSDRIRPALFHGRESLGGARGGFEFRSGKHRHGREYIRIGRALESRPSLRRPKRPQRKHDLDRHCEWSEPDRRPRRESRVHQRPGSGVWDETISSTSSDSPAAIVRDIRPGTGLRRQPHSCRRSLPYPRASWVQPCRSMRRGEGRPVSSVPGTQSLKLREPPAARAVPAIHVPCAMAASSIPLFMPKARNEAGWQVR